MFWKLSTSPEEISSSMESQLVNLNNSEDAEIELKVSAAVEKLNKAAELLDKIGEYKAAELITNLMLKIAEEDELNHFDMIDPEKLQQESKREIENLKENGWVFDNPEVVIEMKKEFPDDAINELKNKYEMNNADDSEEKTWEDE